MTKTRTILIAVLSLAVALASWRFLVFGVAQAMPFMAHHLDGRAVALYAHILLAPVALAAMPFQFWPRLRARRPALHRWTGRVYAVAVLLSGLGGLWLAPGTSAGPVAAWGFGLLAVLWLGSTARAVWLARAGRIAEHRVWMLRSAAMTFGAVTLRLQLGLFAPLVGFETIYVITAWSSWVPNLMLIEWWLRRDRARRLPVAARGAA
ncbi:hypothetical protein CDO87_01865 [Sagittula sp. P11]|uniref:DUF2306 domain-containing protein n=1 Tax=Sagittula sp. P11 TaxID=2009329 RepID=UPI000C2D662A|nr:DUF2306 domain-containing protein [Sagittula sp. P11]AUC52015.1 hypothetical protein CDO87_01865 [Sagittula sp. P11]